MSDAAEFATDRAPLCSGPDPHPGPPTRFKVPPGAVDCHAHIIGLPPRYPLVETRSYTAPEASPQAYLAMLKATGMTHGVLVQPSVHGTDNSLIAETLRAQKGKLRGIAVVAPEVSERELAALNEAGYRGCRLNVLFGGGIGLAAIDTLAKKVAPFGWHLQFLIDVREIAPIAKKLEKLPVPWVVDHMGYVPAHEGASNAGFRTLVSLLRDTDGWVKISGAFRLSSEGPALSRHDSVRPRAPRSAARPSGLGQRLAACGDQAADAQNRRAPRPPRRLGAGRGTTQARAGRQRAQALRFRR